jgi:ATP-dependent DNA ligase
MMKKAMLAHKFDIDRVDYKQSDGYYIQPKLDGVRCLFTANGAYSRNDKQFMNVKHIELALKPFFDQQPDVVLDGELYNHRLKDDFEKIISLVRKQKPTVADRLDAQRLVQFHVYDYFDGTMYDNYKTRMNNLDVSDIYEPSVQYVPTYKVHKHEEAMNMHHDEFLANGYEGSILRDGSALYKHGRSYGLMKFKDFSDTEATIVGYEEGKGKRQGTIGKFLMQDDEGIKFGCPPGKGYTYKDLANMLLNVHDYIGQRATFTYFQRTKANSYRHPLFKTLRNYE